MELIVLGSGTAVPDKKRGSSAFWLATKGGTILLDLSASALHRMAVEDLEWWNVDSIWISHFHMDHCAGLSPFLFATHAASSARERSKPLKIYGGSGLRRMLGHLDEASGNKLFDQPFPLEIVEIEALETFEIVDEVEAVAYSTPHTPESHAIHIRENDKTLVFSSDTGMDDGLATLARHVDLFVLECSYVKDKATEKHLELSDAMYLIRRAEPKRAMLTHFYAEWNCVDFTKEVGRLTPGCEVIEATDGLRIDV